MSNYGNGPATQGIKADRAMSRVDHDVETVKQMTARMESIGERIISHARALGYYEAPPPSTGDAPRPVITTLADALRGLDRAIDLCSGSLNVFD